MSQTATATRPAFLRVPGPKTLITLLITLILVVGEWRYGMMGGFEKLAMTLGTCVAVEFLLSLYLLGRRPHLQSAYISGTSLSLLLRPAAGLSWPFGLVSWGGVASSPMR